MSHRERGGRGGRPIRSSCSPPRARRRRALRDRLALRIGVPSNGPLARTVSSLAFELVGAAARAAGAEPPRLVTAAEQDADIAAILEGHLDAGDGPAWPELLDPAVRRLRGFRTELRELMARATEYDVDPERLRELGRSSRACGVGRGRRLHRRVPRHRRLESRRPARPGRAGALRRRRRCATAVPTTVSRRLRLVVVDDLQEATESTLALLRALSRARGRGHRLR